MNKKCFDDCANCIKDGGDDIRFGCVAYMLILEKKDGANASSI